MTVGELKKMIEYRMMYDGITEDTEIEITAFSNRCMTPIDFGKGKGPEPVYYYADTAVIKKNDMEEAYTFINKEDGKNALHFVFYSNHLPIEH